MQHPKVTSVVMRLVDIHWATKYLSFRVMVLPPPHEHSHEMVGRGSDAVTRRDGALGATSTTTHDESMAISRDIAGLEKDSPREAKRRFSREDANEEYRRAEENASETDTTASRPVANLSQQMSGGSRQEEKWPIPIGSGLSTHSVRQYGLAGSLHARARTHRIT